MQAEFIDGKGKLDINFPFNGGANNARKHCHCSGKWSVGASWAG